MVLNKFSIADVRKIVNAGVKGRWSDGGGLCLQIGEGGGASWVFRYRSSDGRRREMGLGPLHTVTLAAAREAARLARVTRHGGADPIRHRAVAAVTFDQCVGDYLKVRKTATVGWAAMLTRHASPHIGTMSVAAIATEDVLRALLPLWHEQPATATKLRQRIESVLEYAIRVKKLRSDANPAAWAQYKGTLPSAKKLIEKQVKHLPSMHPDELPEFMSELAARDDIAARALEFLILTASRTGDITGQPAKPGKPAKPPLRWADIDLDRALWVIPEDKAGNRGFQVPLSDTAVALLRALPRMDAQVFPMGKTAMWKLHKHMRPDVAVHGYRSTFAGWAKNREYSREVVEVAMKHKVHENDVEKAYSQHVTYSVPRARLMQAWGQFAAGAEEAKVLHLRASS